MFRWEFIGDHSSCLTKCALLCEFTVAHLFKAYFSTLSVAQAVQNEMLGIGLKRKQS